MLEKYKIRGAMLALQEFTVEDLARHSGCNPLTVQTTLSRAVDLVIEIDRPNTKRIRGGQAKVYRLLKGKVAVLKEELEGLYASLPKATPAETSLADAEPFVPPQSLEMAEISLKKFRSTETAHREHLLKKAQISLAGARADLNAMLLDPDRVVHAEQFRVRLESAETLRQTAELHLEAERIFKEATVASDAVQDIFVEKLWTLGGHAAEAHNVLQGPMKKSHILFLDAVNSQWTHGIRESLRPQEAFMLEDDFAHLRTNKSLEEALVHANVCVMTLDSKKGSKKGKHERISSAMHEFITSWPDFRNLVVLDDGFDPTLRNYLLKHQSKYFGQASTLEPDAIRETMGMVMETMGLAIAMGETVGEGRKPQGGVLARRRASQQG